MSALFLNRLLPNTGWVLKISSLVPSSRWGFCLGTLLVNTAVLAGCWLVVTQDLPLSPKHLAVMGLAAQIALIRKRESDIHPKRRWRFGYAAVFAVLAFFWVAATTGIGAEDRMRAIGQGVLGGFLMFQILIFPVTVSCCVRKAPSPP
jgi:hypothetical protein